MNAQLKGKMVMKYEEPNMQIFMIEDDDIICTSGDEVDLGGIQVGPIVPGTGEDTGGYQ